MERSTASALRTIACGALFVALATVPGTAQVPGGEIVGLGGKCLDVFMSDPTDGTEVVMWQCNDTPNQKWAIDPVGIGGTVRIRGLADKCLQADDEPDDLPAREVEIGDCTDPDSLWVLGIGFPNDFGLIHLQSRLNLDVWMSGTADGTPVVIYPQNNSANQEWTFRTNGPPSGLCVPTETALCVQDSRFRVEATWRDFRGNTGVGTVVPGVQSADSGLFWFFNPNNWEILVKVLDNCNGSTNRYWVFAAATTNVEYTLTVTDTLTNESSVYFNPLGRTSPAITDTSAFATCP